MKRNWRQFWNFFLQFCVVVLGVFITFGVSNITERSKERRKTKQALYMVRTELENNLNDFDRKESRIDRQLSMYNSLLDDESKIEEINTDSLIAYKAIFTALYLSDNIHTSLQMAEMSGALSNLKNLDIVDAIYESYGYSNLIVRIEREMNDKKMDNLLSKVTQNNIGIVFREEKNIDKENAAIEFWNFVLNDELLYQSIINNMMSLSVIKECIVKGRESITETITLIDKFLK